MQRVLLVSRADALHTFLQHLKSNTELLQLRIDPMPYTDSARDYWKDPKMRECLGNGTSIGTCLGN